jgi:hypothetical protein
MGELKNQEMHLGVVAPKLPGMSYFTFGKSIETRGKIQRLEYNGTILIIFWYSLMTS